MYSLAWYPTMLFEKNTNQPFYVLGQSNGHLVYAAQATLKKCLGFD